MLFNRYKLKFRTAQRVVQPLQPGRKKVEPKPETGFQNDESLLPPPARRQTVAMPSGNRMVDIAINFRKRRAVGVKDQTGGFERWHEVVFKIAGASNGCSRHQSRMAREQIVH